MFLGDPLAFRHLNLYLVRQLKCCNHATDFQVFQVLSVRYQCL